MTMRTILSLLLTSTLPFGLAACSHSEPAPNAISEQAAPIDIYATSNVPREITPVAGDVYRFQNNNHVAVLVDTDDGVILIDPLNNEAASWVSEQAKSRFGKPITHVIYSHAHYDHASGAAMIPNVKVIAHKNSASVIIPGPQSAITGPYAAWDIDKDGQLSKAEAKNDFAEKFNALDLDSDSYISAKEYWAYMYRDVKMPDQTYGETINKFEINGKAFETHYLGGNHATDLWYVFIPDESILHIVDVLSLGTLPFGDLPWYSDADMKHTYDTALAIPAQIVMSGHGPVGTMEDVRGHRAYMTALRAGVKAGIDAGQTLDALQASLTLDTFSSMEFFERREDNIAGMYRYLSTQ